MIRVDQFIFGYRVYTVDEGDLTLAANLLLKKGIGVRFNKNSFVLSERKSKAVDKLFFDRVKYEKSEIRGVWGFIYKNRKHYGAFIAFFIVAFIAVFSSDVVWDVRIEGCSAEVSEKIEEELSDCGFSVGTRWSDAELSLVEAKTLAASETVSWININRRGTVAYVSVIEKITHEKEEEKAGYSNVVASCDGVIEEITVFSGVAAVKAGDSVKKGDLLISGVIPSELGGGYCYASGTVIGRISDSVEVTVSDFCEVKEQGKEEIKSFSVKIFNFCANIFKINIENGAKYDIIERESPLYFMKKRIPVKVIKKYAVPYSVKRVELGEDEMARRASDEMASRLSERLRGATLVRISTEGAFLDSSYVMKTEFVCLEEIGTDLPFSVDVPK